MNYRNRRLYIILGVLCVLVVFISVAFAALSTTFTMNFGTASKGSHTWNVHFAYNNISSSGNTISPSISGTSDTGRLCGNATFTNNAVSISTVTLSKPGDVCLWMIPIKNEGTIDAKLTSISWTMPTGGNSACTYQSINNINYGIICDDITVTAYQCSDVSISRYFVHCSTYENITYYGDWNIPKGSNYGVLVLEAKYNSNTVNTNAYTLSGTKIYLTFSQH